MKRSEIRDEGGATSPIHTPPPSTNGGALIGAANS